MPKKVIMKTDLAPQIIKYVQFMREKIGRGFVTEEKILKAYDNFYFENNKVMYQWYKLPVNKGNITLKYNIRISEEMLPGKYQLPGYFSYQVNNRLGEISTTTSIEIK